MLINEQNVAYRRRLVKVCQKMHINHFVRGTSGNVSVRIPDGVLVTPSGIRYEEMKPSDIVHLDMEGNICCNEWIAESKTTPTSEWHLHLAILTARPDVNAVIHSHPRFATTIAVLEQEIPAIHYMLGIVNGNKVPCAPYRTFGTKELSDVVVETMGDRRACLLAHHGMVVAASDLWQAFDMTIQVEAMAELYWRSCAIGDPKSLDDEEMNRVRAKFKTMNYGPQ
ncbi:MAG: class II aldolase/adducin family protein [Planctomycetota bacterium]|nr:class II aldolase/adducin family protein [Planctomycetota bacterium]